MPQQIDPLPDWPDEDRRDDALLRLAAVVECAPLLTPREIGRVTTMAQARTVERRRIADELSRFVS